MDGKAMTERTALVLGAGMVGVSTALHLRRRGFAVTLVDRKEPGRETSYGNAGIIQREAVSPRAMPRDVFSLAGYALGRTNDMRYHLSSLPRHVSAIVRYWWNSEGSRHRRISDAYERLIALAIDEHSPLIEAAGAGNLVGREGFRILHRDPIGLAEAIKEATELKERYGVNFSVLSAQDMMRAEPGLKTGGSGAIHWQEPWTIRDPGSLVTAYAELAVREGVVFASGNAATLRADGHGWMVDGVDGPLSAEQAVVALGPWSQTLLKGFGYGVPMVRKRGYHRHYSGGTPLSMPLMDADNGYVMAPMLNGLRITTGAELTTDTAPPDLTQLKHAEKSAEELLALGAPVEADPWFGTRPCMPDMLPVIGQAPRHKGLWLHFGHGHQGFTLGPTTARLLADQMTGRDPGLDMTPYGVERYTG